ncbi:MAG TPA: hypothetical protein VH743_23760 [Beijerinckiaceae bacterium]|jgi:hypothetical protein
MVVWLTRVALAAGGLVAGWFVARDAPNFSVIQGIAAMLIIAAVVAAAALWPALWRRRG